MAAIFGEGKIFSKLQRVHSLDTLWVENFDDIALSRTVMEIRLCYISYCGYLEGSFKVLRLIGVNRVPVSRPRDEDRNVSLLGTFIMSHPNHLVC